ELQMTYASATRPRIERLEHESVEAALARFTAVAKLMDSLFAIPGTRIRLGVDALLGLVPVVGDIASQMVATYLIWEARKLGVPKFMLWRMVGNTLVDTVVGAIPLVGDAFDVAFRANMKKLRLLQRHLDKQGYQTAAPSFGGKGPIIQTEYRRVA